MKVESVYCRFGLYQRNDETFSLVSQMVMAQTPSANKRKQYEIRDHDVLGTGSFEKVMVRGRSVSESRVYTF